MTQQKNEYTNPQMTLPNGCVIEFNNDQTEALQKIRNWIKSKNQFFTLAGFAGTGKSTIIKKIIDEYRGKLVVSAPTHKAKKVIMRTTEQEGQTLHALLGLRPDINLDDFNPNDPKYSTLAPPRISDYNLVIIDEASMINQDLYDLIKDTIKGWKSIKILFMGDPAQIPPVGEKESVVFNGTIKDKHELTKIMRQEDGNPLFEIYDKLRNNLRKSTGGFERKTNLNSKNEGIIYTNDKSEFREQLTRIFDSKEFRRDFDYAKLIAWRNNTVMKSNKLIREIIYGKDVRFLEVGDILMAYRSVRSVRQFTNIIDNSVDYRVKNVSKRIQNKYDLWGYKVKLEELLGNGKVDDRNVFIIDHTDHENLHNYAEIHDGLKEIAKSNKKEWKNYYAFRRESMIMTTIKKFRSGDIRQYGDVIAKDFDYGYAITGHKCLSENMNVLTKRGYIKLKNIKIGDYVCVGLNQYERVINKFNSGTKKSYKLRTKCGYEIYCSKDHRILNKYGDFQPLSKFKIGDYMPINRNNININIDINNRDINYYLGLLVADGSYAGNRKKDPNRINLTVGFDDYDNIKFIENFHKKYELNLGKRRKKNGNCYNYYISNKKWRLYLKELGLNFVKGDSKSVPQSIFTGDYQTKSNFIAGLFDGDGSISKRGRILLVNNSLNLIKEVQEILLEFGIISYIRSEKKSYRLVILGTSINKFKNLINFRLKRKQNALNEYNATKKSNMDFIPLKEEIFKTVKNDLQQKNIFHEKNKGLNPIDFKKFPNHIKNLSYDNLYNIIELYNFNKKDVNINILDIYNNHFFYDEIIDIKSVGDEQMYDLEIENIHQYVTNGFIVHNSQGSTYKYVFILEDDMSVNPKIKERNQIKYVALTRPIKTAIVLNNKK
jgi:exodeoxyribonuclease-5